MVRCNRHVFYEPGKRTLRNFLAAAMQPVGTVLYIYGGGWNLEDIGGDEASAQIGLSKDWVRFFRMQDAAFTYRLSDEKRQKYCREIQYYPENGRNTWHWAGLDCSGYVGWAVYNTMCRESGGESFVTRATETAGEYAAKGWGEVCTYRECAWVHKNAVSADCAPLGYCGCPFCPGDIFSMNGHVWICVGTCRDGSVVILHSTPSESCCGCPGGGVQFSALGKSENCEAYHLADYYMSSFYPEWSRRYRAVVKDFDVYTKGERFRWYRNERGLEDPDGISGMEAEGVLEKLHFRETLIKAFPAPDLRCDTAFSFANPSASAGGSKEGLI